MTWMAGLKVMVRGVIATPAQVGQVGRMVVGQYA